MRDERCCCEAWQLSKHSLLVASGGKEQHRYSWVQHCLSSFDRLRHDLCQMRACRHGTLAADHGAAFVDARQQVEEWLQDAGAPGRCRRLATPSVSTRLHVCSPLTAFQSICYPIHMDERWTMWDAAHHLWGCCDAAAGPCRPGVPVQDGSGQQRDGCRDRVVLLPPT